jgi:hypothetical protein
VQLPTDSLNPEPMAAGDELDLVRGQLEELVSWRRLVGFTVADQERYWKLTEREIELLRDRHLAEAISN